MDFVTIGDALWLYVGVLLFFHLSEYGLTAVYHRKVLSFRSLLISPAYLVALLISLVEFRMENYFFPAWKSVNYGAYALGGMWLIFVGELLRKAAIITAGQSFSHQLQTEKRRHHRLVTRGIYRWFRHPAYLGWFIWAPATQVLLKNPVSFFLFLLVSWKFFQQRIQLEEHFLLSFFGR